MYTFKGIKVKVEQIIKEILGDECGLVVFRGTDKLNELGMNSLKFMNLIVKLENAFNVEVEEEFLDAEKFDTIDKITCYLYEKHC